MPSPHLARACTNVVATPRVGGLVPQAIAHQALETTRQVAEIVQGRAPSGAVNPNTPRAWRLFIESHLEICSRLLPCRDDKQARAYKQVVGLKFPERAATSSQAAFRPAWSRP